MEGRPSSYRDATLAAMPQPQPGQIYRSTDGQPMLFVRTEQPPGSGQPEHLFVLTRNRTVLTRWLPVVPEELKVIHDTDGHKQATERSWLTLVAEHERDLALRLLKKATAWLPRERAKQLQDEWRNAQPPEKER